MVKVEIRCPACAKVGKVEIEENIINQSVRGITAVNVAEFLVCEHSFVAYIDKNLAVRDCFVADFQIELPQIDQQKIERVDVPDSEVIDIYLISININAMWLTYILRGCFYNKKILILNDLAVLNDHLTNFFKFIFQNTFNIDIALVTKILYKKNKKLFKNHIVIDNNKVINDKKQIMKPKLIKIERSIVQSFLAEPDPKSSLIIIKNEINKAYVLAQEVIEFAKDKKSFFLQDLITNFKTLHNTKLQPSYAKFLIGIVENYFGVEVPLMDVSSMLGLL
jgi:hypothetical protein